LVFVEIDDDDDDDDGLDACATEEEDAACTTEEDAGLGEGTAGACGDGEGFGDGFGDGFGGLEQEPKDHDISTLPAPKFPTKS
jgi:hypothetical protein